MRAIQGYSGGSISSLGSDSIDHCEAETFHMNTCLILMVTETELSESTNNNYKTLRIVKKKKLLTGNLILNLIQCLNDKFVKRNEKLVTVRNKC